MDETHRAATDTGGTDDATHELLATTVPPLVTVVMSVLVIAVCTCAAAAAFLVSIPDAVECPFVLAAPGGAGPLRAPADGVLVRVLAVETRAVRKGDTLFVVRRPGATGAARRAEAAVPAAGEPAAADETVVRAAFDATVLSVQRKNEGDVVLFGDELCRLARSDSPLVAELAPPEGDLIRLRSGQQVQLYYDAFRYQRFGAGHATVAWISPAAVVDAGGEHFLVRATLGAQTLGGIGVPHQLRAGMHGVARVVTGRRTLAQFAFEHAFR